MIDLYFGFVLAALIAAVFGLTAMVGLYIAALREIGNWRQLFGDQKALAMKAESDAWQREHDLRFACRELCANGHHEFVSQHFPTIASLTIARRIYAKEQPPITTADRLSREQEGAMSEMLRKRMP